MITKEELANLEPGRLVALQGVAIRVRSAISRHKSYSNEEYLERCGAGWSYTIEAGSNVLMVFIDGPDPEAGCDGLCVYASHTFLDVPIGLVMEYGVIQDKIARA